MTRQFPDEPAPATSITYSRDVTQCQGYRLTSLVKNDEGVLGELELVGKPANAFGLDVKQLVLEVSNQSDQALRVHIYDRHRANYQVPQDLRFAERRQKPRKPELLFHHQSKPFAFWITRLTGEVIFDTRPDKIPTHHEPIMRGDIPLRDTILPAYPLVFSDQYLQIASSVPSETHIYGLGDVVSTSGLRRDNHATVQAFWNGDPAGNPTDRNLYGSHAFYLEAREQEAGVCQSHGVYLRNAHGMDVILRTGVVEYRCLGGTLDFTFVAGPSPHQVVRQYGDVIGRPAQMPFWSFGFQLCSISHKTLQQTREVVERMRQAKIPLEVMWNDFWYMDRKRNFTLSPDFPQDEFKHFIEDLHRRDQRYIPLLDAGIYKPGSSDEAYEEYTTGHQKGVFLKNEDGTEYEGYVWCGKTVWPDWTHAETSQWWEECIKDFQARCDFDGLWLDMNEPANLPVATDKWLGATKMTVVNGKRVVDLGQSIWDYPPYAIHNGWKALGDLTVPPGALTADGWRHYHQHNLYPLQEVKLTRDIMEKAKPNARPFIVSRGTFAGQGSLAAHWLGDNDSKWSSLRETLQGVLQHQLFHIPMVGADVGGFGGDTTEELLNRWQSAGAFLPFYRNHNAGGPQEPYLWPSVTDASRKAIDIRYRLLPYWESLFAQAHQNGTIPVRPLFFEFADPKLLRVDLQFMLGSALLVTPCLYEGKTNVEGFFPSSDGTIWRDWYTHEVLTDIAEEKATIDAPLGHIPLHLRGGDMVLLHTQSCYTLTETRKQPLQLLISLDSEDSSRADFILDDGSSVNGPKTFLSCTATAGSVEVAVNGPYTISQPLDEVTILGVKTKPVAVTAQGAGVDFHYLEESQELIIQHLGMAIDETPIAFAWY